MSWTVTLLIAAVVLAEFARRSVSGTQTTFGRADFRGWGSALTCGGFPVAFSTGPGFLPNLREFALSTGSYLAAALSRIPAIPAITLEWLGAIYLDRSALLDRAMRIAGASSKPRATILAPVFVGVAGIGTLSVLAGSLYDPFGVNNPGPVKAGALFPTTAVPAAILFADLRSPACAFFRALAIYALGGTATDVVPSLRAVADWTTCGDAACA